MRSTRLRLTLSTLFQAVQGGLGVSVTPSHFYFPVPSLKSFHEKDWTARRPCAAVDFRLQEQVQRLHAELAPFASEWGFAEAASADKREFHLNNGFFERIDAEVAYSLVRRRKPRRIVEIGSGNTTLLLAWALKMNAAEEQPGELISIDPHTPSYLKSGIGDQLRLMEIPVQKAPIEIFRGLHAGDILFIDSSHVVSMDSDVVCECLRILPELAPGVLIHFHDIFTPFDYPEKFVMKNLCFWGEQYLLEAFLSFNPAFRVIWSSSAMQHFKPDVLRRTFPGWEGSFSRMPSRLKIFVPTMDGRNVWPCSFWIERVREEG